jgi:molybdopterin molybdotransferase
LLSLEQARIQITSTVQTKDGYERLSLKKAANRLLREDISAPINVPSFRNSSMDGYAFRSHDNSCNELTIIGTSWAGRPFVEQLNQGECIRIFTGAYVPDSCDCVVMQENISRAKDIIKIQTPTKPNENVRNVGDDIKQHQTLLTAGHLLKTADIGLLASCGVAEVNVYKKINVGFFSTGDELASIGTQLSLGQIFDSNRYTLHAMLEESGVAPIDLGVIPDEPKAVEKALINAASNCDVVITTGGVSVGEADFITDVVEKIGTIALWKIAIKPGKPLAFGSINDAAFFGLPGNPVSVMVTFQQVVLPALHKMMGTKNPPKPVTLNAIADENIQKQPGRLDFQRGVVTNIDGVLRVKTTGGQGSHMLSSMSRANCFIVLNQSSGNINKGQDVTIQLLGKNL